MGSQSADFAAIAKKYGGVPVEQKAGQMYPPAVLRVAKQLADYKIPLPTGTALRTPFWQSAMDAAGMLDSDWSAAEYPKRLEVMKYFTKGQGAQAITSFNTVIGHLRDMKKKSEALNNVSATPVNYIMNAIENTMGDPRVKSYNVARNAVASELTRAFRSTGGTEQDVQEWQKQFSENSSPEQFKGAIETAIKLLGSRIGALKNQYQQGMGPNKNMQFLSPQSREILKQIGVNPDELDTSGPTTAPAVAAPPAPPSGGGIRTAEDFLKKHGVPQ